jgi:hypothetical protein
MSDLERLIAAVEAGNADVPKSKGSHGLWLFFHAFPPNEGNSHALALDAYRSSVDAALALFNALLPGWRVGNLAQASACPTDSPDYWTSWIVSPSYLDDCKQSQAMASTPARALLLATLRAYAATQEPKT